MAEATGLSSATVDTTDQPIVLRRDAIGVRPLYYSVSADGRRLAWAERLPSLLEQSWVDKGVDWEGLLDIVTHAQRFDPERTCVAGVRQVPPGHRLEWQPGRLALVREWMPERFLWDGGPGPDDPAGEFADRLQDAVVRHVPAGATILLSGGLDSTAVAAAAVRAGLPVRAVSSVFPRFATVDETERILDVRTALGIEGDLVEVDDHGIEDLDDELDLHGEPHVAPNHAHFAGLVHAAAGQGATVLVDGHDGDGALGSMHGLGRLVLTRPRLASDVLTYLAAAGLPRRAAIRAWATDCLPLSVYRFARSGWRRARPPDITWIDDELRGRISPPVSSNDRWRTAQLAAVGPRLGRAVTMMDRVAARSGIELRHPFADQALLEFLLSLPPEAKHAGGRWKALVRDGFPELPESVRLRPEKTFFDDAVAAAHPLSVMARELSDPAVPVPGVDYGALGARLTSGRPYVRGELGLMRRLALAHRFLTRHT